MTTQKDRSELIESIIQDQRTSANAYRLADMYRDRGPGRFDDAINCQRSAGFFSYIARAGIEELMR